MELDLHVHSNYSADALLSLDKIIRLALKRGLSGIAITDHNTIAGAQKAVQMAGNDLIIICGEEIGTEKGDVVGLFLKKQISSRFFAEVIKEIKEQGGIVILAHPFKKTAEISEDVLNKIDLIEGFNARMGQMNSAKNHQAQVLAQRLNLPVSGGSDAHFGCEIGRGRCILKDLPASSSSSVDKSDKDQIKIALLQGKAQISGQGSAFYFRFISYIIGKIRKIF